MGDHQVGLTARISFFVYINTVPFITIEPQLTAKCLFPRNIHLAFHLNIPSNNTTELSMSLQFHELFVYESEIFSL